MKTPTKRLFIVIVITLLALVVYAGSAWAQSDPTTTTPTPPTNMLQQMEQRFGPQAWAEHIQQMTQIHGADFVSQRLAWMAQQESCPGMNGEGRGMGMMQQRQQGMGAMNGSMMGRGMMGRGMRAQGEGWSFFGNRGFGFWHNPSMTSPTPTPAE